MIFGSKCRKWICNTFSRMILSIVYLRPSSAHRTMMETGNLLCELDEIISRSPCLLFPSNDLNLVLLGSTGHLRRPKGVTCAQNQLCRLELTTIYVGNWGDWGFRGGDWGQRAYTWRC